MTLVEIDPNVRVEGNLTYSGFEDVCGSFPVVGQRVRVIEPESELGSTATVIKIDEDRSLIYLDVDWGGMH
jgi:hypothetical protein